jgi:hypothetical protein
MKPFRIFLAIILAYLWVSNLNADEVYFWTDEDGVINMSNYGPPTDKKVEKVYIPKLKHNEQKEPESRFPWDKTQFIYLVNGQDQDGVARLLGKPDETDVNLRGQVIWYYYNMVENWKNEVESAQIIFRGKRGKAKIAFFK